ncbi:cadherin domain-containing protein [Sulfurimonas sp.]|uniref:cadherin domain-containing protein n=1 Tax=Sulfurimonas sp. TaxID=2022749 RepID=UPI0035693DC1
MKNKILLACLSALLLIFTACSGGGGGGSSSPATSSSPVAFLIDAAVEGVTFTTNSNAGLTGADGAFTYASSDVNVSFTIGDILLHDFNMSNLNSDKKILITDLVGVDRNDSTNTKVVKILQLLQSLDSDNNASNGITISSATRTALIGSTLDFSDANLTVNDINTTLTGIGETLVSQDEAIAHFEQTLNDDFSYALDSIAPIFNSSSTITINENQTFVINLDILDSTAVTLSLGGTDAASFSISGTTLSFNTAPDFEVKTSYALSVTATDTVGNTTTQNISVNISNLNDNSPVISSPASVSVNENQTSAIDINASDADNNSITYSLSGTDAASFDVNSSSGVVTFKVAPDYETKSSYSFNAIASDGVNSDTQSVTININNISDVIPTIENFTASIDENASIGEVLGSVTITSSGDANVTSFTLSDTTNFLISSSGVITTKTTLDYETTQVYNLTAYATNAAGNSLSKNITININNIADVVPTLNAFAGSVDENATIGTSIGTVSVNSSGDSSITSYTLSSTTNFLISSSGVITTKTTLDYETTPLYNLTVYATNAAGNSSSVNVTINVSDIYELVPLNIPTVVVVMNWNNYSETDASVWYDKIFNASLGSVNNYFNETTGGKLQIVPITESSGTANDGIIMVSMGKNHPGGYDNTTFRDTEITNAITNAEVVNSADFAALDTNGDGALDRRELQIIFIVAGGEESYGDPVDHSIWAHAWAFDSGSTLQVDGKYVMRYTGVKETSGGYGRFGANHDTHKATIGIIAHELGHSLLALGDYYDNGGGSGLGWYDIMSGGSWAYKSGDTYPGETPTQFTAYNRVDADLDAGVTDVNSSQSVTITCSSRELIKLVTTKSTEYFMIECRDTAKTNSDIALQRADSTFTTNRLFMAMYHIDTAKAGNTEDGTQTNTNHYKVALVEKDTGTLLTSTINLKADFDDVYTLGDTIDSTRTKLYDTTDTGYSVTVTAEDYTNRTMTISITK